MCIRVPRFGIQCKVTGKPVNRESCCSQINLPLYCTCTFLPWKNRWAGSCESSVMWYVMRQVLALHLLLHTFQVKIAGDLNSAESGHVLCREHISWYTCIATSTHSCFILDWAAQQEDHLQELIQFPVVVLPPSVYTYTPSMVEPSPFTITTHPHALSVSRYVNICGEYVVHVMYVHVWRTVVHHDYTNELKMHTWYIVYDQWCTLATGHNYMYMYLVCTVSYICTCILTNETRE